MKKTILKVLVAVAAGSAFSSCALEPMEVPAEEMFLRNFLKTYGRIDPEQDWNMAQSSDVTIIPDGKASSVNVLVKCGKGLYRVAEYRDVVSEVTIPLDVPEGTATLMVDIDGKRYTTTVNGIVDARKDASYRIPGSRDTNDNGSVSSDNDTYQNMAWLIVAEDLGTTDDMDFNDIIVSIEMITVNYKTNVEVLDWQVVEMDQWNDVDPSHNPNTRADIPNDPNGNPCKRMRVKAKCAGGTLPLWLHYNNGVKDYIVGWTETANMHESSTLTTETEDKAFEWHRWFNIYDHTIMINTGTTYTETPTTEAQARGSQIIYVNSDFSLTNYSFVDYDGYRADPLEPTSARPEWSWQADLTKYMIKGFYITVGGVTVTDCNNTLFAPSKGEAPQMFLIPDVGPNGTNWHWPTERTNIVSVYDKFRDWVGNANNNNWFLQYKSGAEAEKDYMRID